MSHVPDRFFPERGFVGKTMYILNTDVTPYHSSHVYIKQASQACDSVPTGSAMVCVCVCVRACVLYADAIIRVLVGINQAAEEEDP